MTCLYCFTASEWGPWSAWSKCIPACGSEGKQNRTRQCTSGTCPGEAWEGQGCMDLPACPGMVYDCQLRIVCVSPINAEILEFGNSWILSYLQKKILSIKTYRVAFVDGVIS